MRIFLLGILFHGLINIEFLECHPQCLDHLPPHSPQSPLNFCTDYGSYSCCSSNADKDLQKTYDEVLKTSRVIDIPNHCDDVLRDLLCLRCHPYAAHVFDAEVSYENKTFKKSDVEFPGLCFSYCYEQFSRCKSLILGLPLDDDFKAFMSNSTINDFCTWAEIPDKMYCYPSIKDIEKDIDLKRREGGDSIQLCVESNNNEFSNPLVAVHSNDGTHRLFVGEQRGMVYILDHLGEKLEKPFLDIRDRVINSGEAWDERGFLGLVFHPKYKHNGHFYVFYSAPNIAVNRANYSDYEWYWKIKHTIQVSEFTVDPNDPNRADHNSEMVLLRVNQPAANHNGGMLFFGEDGYLYISLGDGGGAGDQYHQAQDLSTLLGTILRINVNVQNKLYHVPRSNPFRKRKNARPEIFAYGARNMWRCSVDRGGTLEFEKGRIFCGDVGQSRFEEIDIIKKGRNYGWSGYEGFECFNKTLCAMKLLDLEFPIITYNHSFGQSIVGGYVYRGCNAPILQGHYIYGDTMNGNLFIAKEIKGKWITKEISMGNESLCNKGLEGKYFKNILSFGEDEAGELFILSVKWPSPFYKIGKVYRVVDPLIRGDPEICKPKVQIPQKLKKIRRRQIYQKYSLNVKPRAPVCKDKKKGCKKWFRRWKGKKPKYSCKKWETFAQQFCRSTCNHC